MLVVESIADIAPVKIWAIGIHAASYGINTVFGILGDIHDWFPPFFGKFGKSGIEDVTDSTNPFFDILRLYRIEPLQ